MHWLPLKDKITTNLAMHIPCTRVNIKASFCVHILQDSMAQPPAESFGVRLYQTHSFANTRLANYFIITTLIRDIVVCSPIKASSLDKKPITSLM